MAVLNIKDFPPALYKALRVRAKREGRSLAQEVIHILRQTMQGPEKLSILDLRGLGKELWQAEDGAQHVRRERDSWD